MNKKRILKLLPAVVLTLLLLGDGVFFFLSSPSRLFSAPPSFESSASQSDVDDESDSSAAALEEDGNSRPDFGGSGDRAFPGAGGHPGRNRGALKLMRWRFLCLPVGAALVIAEIVYLLQLRRKKLSAEEGVLPEFEDPAERRMRTERRTRRIGIAALCGVLVLSLVLQLVRTSVDSGSSSVTVNEEVKTAVAQQGTLESTLQSSGVVASAQEEALSVPGSITVKEYLVSDGDAVEAGDDIAVLERESVLSAIAEVQDLLDEIDEEIDEVLERSASSTITSPTSATLVKVYAKSGENVTDVMYDHGALALLSLDERLAVKVDNPGGYTIGDEVTVTDGSAHSETGRVSRVEKETLTITVDLSDFTYGKRVTVTGKKGKTLGKGKLFVYSPLRITGYSGTVTAVHRSAGASLSKDSKLFTLSDGERTAEYQTLLRKRSKLVEQYNRLMTISRTGRLQAEQAGLISGLDQSLLRSTQAEQAENPSEKAEKEDGSGDKEHSSAETASQSSSVMGTTQSMSLRSGGTAQTMALRSGSGNVNLRASASLGTNVMLSAEQEAQEEAPQEVPMAQTEIVSDAGNDSGDGDAEQGSGDSGESGTSGDSGESGESGSSGEGKQSGDSDSEAQTPSADTVSRTVSVHWKGSTGAALSEGLPGSLLVVLKADGKAVDTAQLSPGNGWSKSWSELSAGSSYTVSCDVPSGFTGSAELSGDSIVLTFTQSEQEGGIPGQGGEQQGSLSGKFPSGSGMSGKGKMGTMSASFAQGTSSGTGAGAAAQESVEEDSSYTLAETTLGQCISNDRVCVDVSVDELDVNSITLGQEATVTLDALEGQSFTGTVTAVSAAGTNEGGNTKFTLTVTMDKDSSVLLGMSANVTLVTRSSSALLLPETAITEQAGKTFVYTSYDEKNDELGGLTEVTTGAADGESVAILSGLEQGTTCYYRYADSIRYSFLRR